MIITVHKIDYTYDMLPASILHFTIIGNITYIHTGLRERLYALPPEDRDIQIMSTNTVNYKSSECHESNMESSCGLSFEKICRIKLL